MEPLRQTGTISDYCNDFHGWFKQCQVREGFSDFVGVYLFIDGLKPEIWEIFVDWHQYSCNRVEDAISLALKIDANGLQDSFSPFDPESSFYNKELEWDTTITLDELMKDNAFFRNGMIQETIIDEVIDDKDLEKSEQRADDKDSLDISENIDSAYKVFDESPEIISDEIRTEIEAQFSDIYICETILRERLAQKIAIHEISDVIVVMDDSSILVFRHFKNEFGDLNPEMVIKVSHGEVMDFYSFGDNLCFGDFWGQKSLKEGVLGITSIGSFGWKPGWISSTNLGSEGSFLDNIDYQGFSLSQNFEWAQGKAGKDGDHVVVYEGHEYGLVLVGIHNGLDAFDFLPNVYHFVHKKLQGLLRDDDDKELVSSSSSFYVTMLDVSLSSITATLAREGNHPAAVVLLAVLGAQTANIGAASISNLRWLGKAEGEKPYIIEETASGYTTLVALAFKETFKTGAYLYGVAEAFKNVASQDTEKNVKINVLRAYSTKRSTRLVEKECARIGIIKDSMHKGSFGNFSKNDPLLFHLRSTYYQLVAQYLKSTHYQLAAQYLKEKKTCFDDFTSLDWQEGWVVWLLEVPSYLRECSRRLASARDFISCSTKSTAFSIIRNKLNEENMDVKIVKPHAITLVTLSIFGGLGVGSVVHSSNICPADPKVHEFKMDWLFPATKAMLADVPQHPFKVTIVTRVVGKLVNVDNEKQQQRIRYGPKFLEDVAPFKITDELIRDEDAQMETVGRLSIISLSTSTYLLVKRLVSKQSLIGKQGKASGALVIPYREKLLINHPELIHQFVVLNQMYGSPSLQISEILMEKLPVPATFSKLFMKEVVVPFKKGVEQDFQDGILIGEDEIFRPVQSSLKFKVINKVIRRCRLAADVYTQNLATVTTLNGALKAGALWINCFDIIDVAISFKWIQAEWGLYLQASWEFWMLVNKVP